MRAVMAILLTLCSAPAALAEEPRGFDAVAWGTTRRVMTERLLRDRCGSQQTLERVSGRRVICFAYRYGDVGAVNVTFDFADDALHGYEVVIPPAESPGFKKAVLRELGPATVETGMSQRTLTWYWPSGTTAIFEQHCFGTAESCFTVRTGVPLGTTAPSRARASRASPAAPR